MEANDLLILAGEDPEMVGTPTGNFLARISVKTIPDATFALVISTAVDQALELAIATHFEAEDDVISLVFDGNANGPLGDFAARIKMGRALGIYPAAIKEELDLIRHIRNAFAHSWEKLDFANETVIAACSQLRIPNHLKQNPLKPKVTWTPKSRYLFSARHLYAYLEWREGGQPVRFATHPHRAMFEEVQAAREKE